MKSGVETSDVHAVDPLGVPDLNRATVSFRLQFVPGDGWFVVGGPGMPPFVRGECPDLGVLQFGRIEDALAWLPGYLARLGWLGDDPTPQDEAAASVEIEVPHG